MTQPSSTLDLGDLQAQREFVRRLALRLLGDAERSEDVAQETLRVALEHPPRSRTRAWLAKVGRSLALRELRSASRREQRERHASRSAESGDPAQAVIELEWTQEVADAVLQLPEPLRCTVLRRYWRGWSVRRIAREEGVTARAVEARLLRAHQRLRRRLDERGGVRRGAWVLGLASLVRITPGPLPPGATACAVLGAISMKTAGVVLAAAVMVAAFFMTRGEEPRSPAEEGPLAASVEPPIVPEDPVRVDRVEVPEWAPVTPEVPVEVDTPAPEPTRRELAAWRQDTPPGVLAGIVLQVRTPVTDGVVRIKKDESFGRLERPWKQAPEVRIGTLDGQGRFRFEGLETGSYVVGVEAGRHRQRELWCDVGAEQPGRSLVVVFGDARLFGTIHGEDGGAIPGAMVALGIKAAVGSDDFHLFQAADSRGRYEFAGLPGGTYWFTVEPGGSYRYWFSASSRTVPVAVGAGGEWRHDHGQSSGLPRIEGRLLGSDGRAVQGPGTLLVLPEGGGYSEVSFDARGVFELRVAPGRYRLQPRLPSGKLAVLEEIEVTPGMSALSVTLPGVRVVGRVFLQSGEPLPRLRSLRVSLSTDDAGIEPDRREVVVSEEGRFVFDAVLPGRWTVRTFPSLVPEGAAEADLQLRSDEAERRLDLPLVAPD